MPMFTIRGTHLRSLVDFLWCKRRSSCENIQRDDVTLRVWNTLSVSELTLPTFNFCCTRFSFCYYFRKNHNYDPNKPLVVPAGSDCFDKIDNLNEAGSIRSMHKYKSVFASNFKQVNDYINTYYVILD